MYEIVPNLYLSSYAGLIDAHKYFNINATRDLPMKGRGIRVALDDAPWENTRMYEAFPVVIQTIDLKLSQGVPVVVHCYAGQQRSAAIVAAYITYKNGGNMSVDQAIQFIKSKKPDVFPGRPTFHPALDQWNTR